jgi:Na+/H+ antiporter NhaD/arsenite permease-like protein
LFVGALVANVLGTTGASMLLIRPWLRMNKYRITGHHVVFFIFIVSNVGGCLTPIGDPPLFLGYLRGVPFWWVAEKCWPMWLTGLTVLLAMFYAVDRSNYVRAPREVRATVAEPPDAWRFDGLHNVLFLAVILAAVFINQPALLREALMIGAALGSWLTTDRRVHESNHFTFHPIQEVAILFVGIFATMMPALDWLEANAATMQNASPALFYWGSGTLSSVLDNAPTYLSFLSAAVGKFGGGGANPEHLRSSLGDGSFARIVMAISVGAVFFGANTYIGNGPNFMVKAIADHQKVRTPTFMGYLFKFTLPFMVPMLALVWWLFFRS